MKRDNSFLWKIPINKYRRNAGNRKPTIRKSQNNFCMQELPLSA